CPMLRRSACFAIGVCVTASSGCGARTGLLVPPEDTGNAPADATPDTSTPDTATRDTLARDTSEDSALIDVADTSPNDADADAEADAAEVDSAPITVVQIAVGDTFACVVLTDGTVRCWGANDSGNLGDGTLRGHHTPAPVV